MVLNTTAPLVGEAISSLELLEKAGYPITTSGQETLVSVRPSKDGKLTSWGEIIHLRHHPGRQLTVFADSVTETLDWPRPGRGWICKILYNTCSRGRAVV